MQTIKTSVHGIVDILLRRGHLDSRIFNRGTMVEGTRLHSKFQSNQGERYIPEFFLSGSYQVEDYIFELEGRADGLIINLDAVIIDEIKTMVGDIDQFYNDHYLWHLGQAKMYAYMYAKKNSIKNIGVRLTYIHQISEEHKVYDFNFSFEELEKFFFDLLNEYLVLKKKLKFHLSERSSSVKKLVFPYQEIRSGQDEMIDFATTIATHGGNAYIEAPTGIGKTMAALFPFVKALEDESIEKIFYLTSKNSIKNIAIKSAREIKKAGADVSAILLTSKEIICPNIEARKHCNPDECVFARNYYSKINDILKMVADKSIIFDRKAIDEISFANTICPFELQLDLSLLVDIVVCDYNYVFDPFIKLQRYFEAPIHNFLLLVDEAHNLVSRSREMFSVEISKNEINDLIKEYFDYTQFKLKKSLKDLIKYFTSLASLHEITEEYVIFEDGIEDEFIEGLENFKEKFLEMQRNDQDSVSEKLLDFYFKVNRFLQLPYFMEEGFIHYFHQKQYFATIEIQCLDAKKKISASLYFFKATLFFSATLTPLPYYVELLGGKEEDIAVKLPSPFPVDNLLLMVMPTISTYFRSREESVFNIYLAVNAMIEAKIGNYIIFFPSYDYLEKVLQVFRAFSHANLVVQERSMIEEERVAFLDNFAFSPKFTTLGFCVLGGVFGEGIDLVAERLIGVAIVGVGLPAISFNNDMLKNYFSSQELNGYNYAYVNPGMNKVMQAVGRVIRSSTDKGVVLLIDERYAHNDYKVLFKEEWCNYVSVTNNKDIKNKCLQFWEENK